MMARSSCDDGRFTKRLPGYISSDYPARLVSLGQCSLEKRRIVHDLALMSKLVFKTVDVQMSIFLPYEIMLSLLEVTHTRSH